MIPTGVFGQDSPEVAVTGHFNVEKGRLRFVWDNVPAQEARLQSLYGGNSDRAKAFRQHIGDEINAELGGLNPLVDWLHPDHSSDPEEFCAGLTPAQRQEAKAFSGSVQEWAGKYSGLSARQFGFWRATYPPPASQPKEGNAPDPPPAPRPLTEVLPEITASLIGQFHLSEVEAIEPPAHSLKVWFRKPEEITRVRLMIGEAGRQKTLLESDLKREAGDLNLSWSDDLAVQRMSVVLGARGFWNEFAPGSRTEPRRLHWLEVAPLGNQQAEARVHPPHICYLIFMPEANSDQIIETTVGEVLPPAARPAVEKALAREKKYGEVVGNWPVEDRSLGGVVSRRIYRDDPLKKGIELRIVDLFALNSYLASHDRPREELSVPVTAAWFSERLRTIALQGYRVVAAPAGTAESRLFSSRNLKRKSFERGGIEVWISRPPRKKADDQAKQQAPADPDQSPLHAWLSQNRVTAEFGASVQEGEPVEWKARVSTVDGMLLGNLSAELSYSDRFSGRVNWTPLVRDESSPALPPSFAVFSDSAVPREVDGEEVAFEQNGVRASQRYRRGTGDPFQSRERWIDYGIAVARVKDLTPAAVPTANQLAANLGFGLTSRRNVWDARQFGEARLNLTGVARGEDDYATWLLVELAAQWSIPRGSWAYAGSLNLQTTLGQPAPDALPYVGGNTGVRGVRPYALPARTRLISRNEFWFPTPLIARDVGKDQKWFNRLYEVVKPACFVDIGWADSIHEDQPTSSWSISPGVGIRLNLGRAVLSIDYAYGFINPEEFGRGHFSLGASTRY